MGSTHHNFGVACIFGIYQLLQLICQGICTHSLQAPRKTQGTQARRQERKQEKIAWDQEDTKAFEEMKHILCPNLELQRVNPYKPFVLRVDASRYAVGATLEQLKDGTDMPTPNDVMERKTIPVAFMSRKLTSGQRNWVPREQETYAIILALEKWQSWIGLQPVLVLTDHKAIESWAKEVLDTPSGPLGRRSRWHQMLSKYDLTVGYIPGKDNSIADILSRWAYPASQAYRDTNKHGSEEDREQMREMIEQERAEERECMVIRLKNPPMQPNDYVRGRQVSGIRKRTGTKDPVPSKFTFKKPLGTPAESTPPAGSSLRRAGTGTAGTGVEGTRESTPDFQNEPEPGVEERPGRFSEGEQPGEGDVLGGQPTCSSTQEGTVTFQEVHLLDWTAEYESCPIWSETWKATLEPYQLNWPKGIHVTKGRMFLNDKLCIPEAIMKPWIRAHHAFMGHVGSERIWAHMETRFVFSDPRAAKQFTHFVGDMCEICQACQRSPNLKGPIEPTPIREALMNSVALDLFRMPLTEHCGKKYDTMAVCVDRHSGWMVAVPCLNKGTTGASVAQDMLKQQWRPFGIPALVTSDQGSQFVSSWWQNLCAGLGIRQAYSQAYHHQANGRAEVAGQQLMEVLRKLHVEEGLDWVEALPQALDRIHDVKGQVGLSPYEIMFGRQRPMAGLPYTPVRQCEDAKEFMDRMKEVDVMVAEQLNVLHKKQARSINSKRRIPKPLELGDKVWYRRPENTGEKTDSRWLGPARIISRKGEFSYEIQMENDRMDAHRTFLKEYTDDTTNGNPVQLYYHKRTVRDDEAKPGECIVDRILNHRTNAQGKLEFLTLWQGETMEEATWEPPNSFFHRYGVDLIKYCKSKGIPLDVTIYLQDKPHQD